MATRYANKEEAEKAAHTLSHQPWVPHCEWRIIERNDGTAYVRGYMDPSIPEGEDRSLLDGLKCHLGGQFRVDDGVNSRTWHGRYGKAEVCISMPERERTAKAPRARKARPTPPPMVPCRESELLEENARLRQVIAHLMTNPLNQREATYWTSDIDGQPGTVQIVDSVDHAGVPVTTVRVADRATEK